MSFAGPVRYYAGTTITGGLLMDLSPNGNRIASIIAIFGQVPRRRTAVKDT